MLAPFECLCGNFILPEPASYVFFYDLFNLRKLLYLIAGIRRRVLASSCYPVFFRGHQRVGTPEYLSMMRLRKIWAEGSFSVLKREHCISKIRKRDILAATEECLLAAMALNLKRMAKCHLSLSPNLLFCWNHCGFQQFFCFCQQVQILTAPNLDGTLRNENVK